MSCSRDTIVRSSRTMDLSPDGGRKPIQFNAQLESQLFWRGGHRLSASSMVGEVKALTLPESGRILSQLNENSVISDLPLQPVLCRPGGRGHPHRQRQDHNFWGRRQTRSRATPQHSSYPSVVASGNNPWALQWSDSRSATLGGSHLNE